MKRLRHVLWLCIATVLAFTQSAQVGAQDTPAFQLENCSLPGINVPARCGSYPVFENRDTQEGRKISLRVVVIPASGEKAQPDPVVFIAGGPGASSVELAGEMVNTRAVDLIERDFVFIDYRGTGKSHPLICPHQQEQQQSVSSALESFIPLDRVSECFRHLSQNADLSQYNTQNIVDDLAEVTAGLGYRQLNLWGGSYGTRAVLMFLRRHSDRVRTAVLEGVTPMDARIPQYFARDAQTALDAWFMECAQDEACAKAFPDPAADLAQLLKQLEHGPQQIEITDAETGEVHPLKLSRNGFVQTLRYQLYVSATSLGIPAYLHAASQGDWQALGEAAYAIGSSLLNPLPDGLYLSVTCSEDVSFIQDNVERFQTGFMGDFRLRQQRAACADWPVTRMSSTYLEPVRSAVPSLIISGANDPVTPAYLGEQVAQDLSQSRHLVIPFGGHGPFGLLNIECVAELQHQLIQQANVDGLDVAACAAQIKRPGFLLNASREPIIVLSPEQQQAFTGSYQNPDASFQLSVLWEKNQLQAQVGERIFVLQPISAQRFSIAGAPPGSYFDFTAQDGAMQLSIQWAGGAADVLERQ